MSDNPDTKKIRVLIVDDVTETRENLKKLLSFEDDVQVVGTAGNGREGVEQAASIRPDIVLMDINMPGMDGIAASEIICQSDPFVQVIMMSVQGESDYLRRSMLAGAREFLIKPFTSEELATSLRRVHQLSLARRAAAPPPGSAESAPPAVARSKPKGAKVIAVYSPKGGVGVSTIAVNLAIAMKEETRQRVALFDASFQFGDVSVLLNVATNRTIADVIGGKREPDEDILTGFMAAHGSGLKVLLAPPSPEMAELVTADQVRAILGIMNKMFDYVIVDTGKALNEPLLAILDAAERIVLVSTADLDSLKDVKLFFEVMDKLEYPPDKTAFILSKYDSHATVSAREIEANIKQVVTGVVPRDDKVAAWGLNRGIPFVLTHRSNPIGQAMFSLAKHLERQPEEAAEAPAAAPAAAKRPAPPPHPIAQPFLHAPPPPPPPAPQRRKWPSWFAWLFGRV